MIKVFQASRELSKELTNWQEFLGLKRRPADEFYTPNGDEKPKGPYIDIDLLTLCYVTLISF
jgi:hypothetical protein